MEIICPPFGTLFYGLENIDESPRHNCHKYICLMNPLSFNWISRKVVENVVLYTFESTVLKGPYFNDLVLRKDFFFGIFSPYLFFRVLVFTISVSFTQRISIWNFHTLSFWVLMLAAGDP